MSERKPNAATINQAEHPSVHDEADKQHHFKKYLKCIVLIVLLSTGALVLFSKPSPEISTSASSTEAKSSLLQEKIQSPRSSPASPISVNETLKSVVPERHRAKSYAERHQSFPSSPYITGTPYNQTIQSKPPRPLKVPYPILVLNLPKSGTTTIWQYFECGLGKDPEHAVHWWTTGNQKQIGPCFHYNLMHQQDVLHRCGDYDVWIDCGYVKAPKNAAVTDCFFPAVHGLENFYQHHPNGTILFIEREVEAWYQSAAKWGNGNMLRKWSRACRSSFFPQEEPSHQEVLLTEKDWKEMYQRVTQNVRQFSAAHPSLTYLEPDVTLEDPAVGSWLEEHVGIAASCWGKCQPNGQTATCEET